MAPNTGWARGHGSRHACCLQGPSMSPGHVPSRCVSVLAVATGIRRVSVHQDHGGEGLCPASCPCKQLSVPSAPILPGQHHCPSVGTLSK